jgi:hypothetical protein
VISHIGETDSGHYIALVHGDLGQWFCCDDEVISRSISRAFGCADGMAQDGEDVRTGYLLFYTQAGRPEPGAVSIAEDLRRDIDRENEQLWPDSFLFSSQLLSLAPNLANVHLLVYLLCRLFALDNYPVVRALACSFGDSLSFSRVCAGSPRSDASRATWLCIFVAPMFEMATALSRMDLSSWGPQLDAESSDKA